MRSAAFHCFFPPTHHGLSSQMELTLPSSCRAPSAFTPAASTLPDFLHSLGSASAPFLREAVFLLLDSHSSSPWRSDCLHHQTSYLSGAETLMSYSLLFQSGRIKLKECLFSPFRMPVCNARCPMLTSAFRLSFPHLPSSWPS